MRPGPSRRGPAGAAGAWAPKEGTTGGRSRQPELAVTAHGGSPSVWKGSISQRPTIHRLRHCPPPPKRDGTTGLPPRHAGGARVRSVAAAFCGRDASLLTPIAGRHAAVLRWNSPEGVVARGLRSGGTRQAGPAPTSDDPNRGKPPIRGRLLWWEVVGRDGLKLGSNRPEAFTSLLSALSPHSYTHRARCALTIALNDRRVISRPENRSAPHTKFQVRGRSPYKPSRQSCGEMGCWANPGGPVGGVAQPLPGLPAVAACEF